MREPSHAGRHNVLAVIPARGGSKGLPRKNLLDLCGLPLLAYSINAARRCPLITRVVVSTEDQEIAAVAREHGAVVPFMRPADMARDDSLPKTAVDYTVNTLRARGYSPDVLVVFYPTHPFRPPRLVDQLVAKGLEGYGFVTVKSTTHDTTTLFSLAADGALIPLLSPVRDNAQASRLFSRPYGLLMGTSFSGLDRIHIHTVTDPVSLIDIDTLEDFRLAEEVIRCGLYPGEAA